MAAPVSPPPRLPDTLVAALRQSRSWGFLGEGPIDTHIAHAEGFAAAASASIGPVATQPPTGRWIDLGSGGGIPGLVLAHLWPDRPAVLLDSNERRTRFLARVVDEQGWAGRVKVITDRAEVAGRHPDLREAFSLVVARSFGSPAVTAECAAPFLRVGGLLVVSEPPTDPDVADPVAVRWPEAGLATVGLAPVARRRNGFGYQVLVQAHACPDRFPRRTGVPGKRPLY